MVGNNGLSSVIYNVGMHSQDAEFPYVYDLKYCLPLWMKIKIQ